MNKIEIFETLWMLIPGHRFKNILRIKFYKIFNKMIITPKTTVKKGATVLLVGIHVAQTVETWLDAVGVNGRVIVVEASKESYDKVKKEIIEIKKYDNAIFENIAAWNKEGTKTIEIGDRPGSTKVKNIQAHYTKEDLAENNIYYTGTISHHN